MKIIKKILITLLVLSMTVGLFSCKKDEVPAADTSTDTAETIAPISFLDYTVVRPEFSSDTMLDGVSYLYMQLMELSGKDNGLSTDYLADGQESDSNVKEILIGHTNRPETEQVLSQLANNEFAVAVVGNKLVITGIVENLTPYAIDYFIETYLGEGADGNVAGDLFYKGTKDVVVLIDKGEPVYTVVRPEIAFETMKEMCVRIYDIIYNATGVSIPVKTDDLLDGETHDESAYEILIGDVSYDMLEDVKSNILPDEYRIDFVGNKIIIYAWSVEGMTVALETFNEMLTYGHYTDSEGNTTVSILKDAISGKDESLNFYTNVPQDIDGVRYNSVYNAYDGAMMLYWKEATDDMLGAYAESLVTEGFKLHQSLDNDSVHSVTYAKDDVSVCAYYLKRLGELRVVAQDNVKILPVQPYEYEKICDPCVTQVGSYKSYTKAEHGDMGYIIRLEDGTFVIIDGGYAWAQTATDIYNKLLELKPPQMDEIIISAWFISHGHSDHFGVLSTFIQGYSDKVTVKMLLGNDVPELTNGITDRETRVFNYNSVNGKFGGCVNVKIHTGQQFFFPGATITVISTQEDIFPNAYANYNDYSTLIDTVIKDTRFMWFADAQQDRSSLLVDMYKEDLKCDVVQIAHHGNSGTVTTRVYELCDPEKAFWPIAYADYGHLDRYNRVGATRYIVDKVGWENVYILGEGFYTIWFDEMLSTDGLVGSDDTNGDYTDAY